jgi:hypothetical protein
MVVMLMWLLLAAIISTWPCLRALALLACPESTCRTINVRWRKNRTPMPAGSAFSSPCGLQQAAADISTNNNCTICLTQESGEVHSD